MLIGYARVSKTDVSQVLDLQRDASLDAGVTPGPIYQHDASGKRDDRPGSAASLKALRKGEVLVVLNLDRLGSDLRHRVNTAQDWAERGIGLIQRSGGSHPRTVPTETGPPEGLAYNMLRSME